MTATATQSRLSSPRIAHRAPAVAALPPPRPGTNLISPADIRRMVDIIVAQFHPEKIILFGSYARGEAGPDSDVDLLVVKETDGDLLDLAADIATAVWRIPVAKDILVRTPAQVERSGQAYWTVIHEALQKGTVLFERSGA